MPMFNEDAVGKRKPSDCDSQHSDSAPIPIQSPPGMGRWLSHRLSEESIRTELCEGLLPDSPPRPATPQDAVSRAVSDRAELIERLKRGESPTWVPHRHLESLFQQTKAASPPRTPQPAGSSSPGLLPAPTITPERQDAQQGVGSPLGEGPNIERPRSALHSGNFTPVELSPGAEAAEDAILPDIDSQPRATRAAWMSTSPPLDYTSFGFAQGATSYRRDAFKSGPSSLSSSLSSSFVYQPPTSPLVQSESNDELDLTLPLNSFNINANSPRNSRRHTLNSGHSPFGHSAFHRQSPLRRESTYPYQAHQPRRSLHSTPSLSLMGISPNTPGFARSRRPSLGSEASPLQHASMVGSYEESILRGRMSTTPSRPLEFTSQIGVLGLGKCKASLRCPRHVALPFSAVFYNYAGTTSGETKVEDGPSPYVGQIDLENGLPNIEEGQRAKRKLQSRYQDLKGGAEEIPAHDTLVEVSEGESASKAAKPKRPSRSPKVPPGGGYRIPEKGQLQIIIKNQNKTAVKLFLVPYDLAGMEPGTKTFIRQRSYSAGPIIETEVPSTAKDAPATSADRPTLRYLIHLHICCPSKGRFYLYKSIRVVFANRVPDGKERLRNEVTYPDPRFTPYKPMRVMHPPPLPGTHTASGTNINSGSNIIPPSTALVADQAFRRRSAGFALGQQQQQQQQHHYSGYQQPYWHHQPFHPPEPQNAMSMTSTAMEMPGIEMTNLFTTTTTTTTTIPPIISTPTPTRTPIPLSQLTTTNNGISTPTPNRFPIASGIRTYDKLSKGDAGYGGGSGSSARPYTSAEGLLSKRLRSLGVQQHPPPPPAFKRDDGAATSWVHGGSE